MWLEILHTKKKLFQFFLLIIYVCYIFFSMTTAFFFFFLINQATFHSNLHSAAEKTFLPVQMYSTLVLVIKLKFCIIQVPQIYTKIYRNLLQNCQNTACLPAATCGVTTCETTRYHAIIHHRQCCNCNWKRKICIFIAFWNTDPQAHTHTYIHIHTRAGTVNVGRKAGRTTTAASRQQRHPQVCCGAPAEIKSLIYRCAVFLPYKGIFLHNIFSYIWF